MKLRWNDQCSVFDNIVICQFKWKVIYFSEMTWLWETLMDFDKWGGKWAYEIIEKLIIGNL